MDVDVSHLFSKIVCMIMYLYCQADVGTRIVIEKVNISCALSCTAETRPDTGWRDVSKLM